MPQVQFYHDTPDRIALACELTARAYARGRRVALRAADHAHAQRIDQALWRFEPAAFVPHVMQDAPLAGETPVLINHGLAPVPRSHQDILINLSDELPPEFQSYRVVVEIIGQSEADKAPGRLRYKHYKALDLPIKLFDALRREAL